MDKQSLLNEAFRNFREGQSDSALKKYQKALAIEPQDANVLNMLGDISFRQGQVIEAIGYFQRAVLALGNKKSDNKVEMLKKKMIRLDPDSVDDLELPAKESPDLPPAAAQAIEELKSAIAANPKNFENYQKLGDLLAKNGSPREAAEQYLVIGNALYTSRMYKKAGTVFKKIISLDAHCLPARIAMGEIYAKDGSDSDAKKELLFVAGRLIRQNNLERGQLFAQKAIQLKSIEAHYYLGLVYLLNGQAEEASREMETLLKFKVNHQSGLTQLARIRAEGKQYEEAAQLYERLIKADAKNAYAHECLGAMAREQNQPDLAGEKYTKAMDTYAANEDWEMTAYCAHLAIELDRNNQELYLKLADASYNAGLEVEAAEACLALADLLDAEGKSQEAEEMRGKAREIQGKEAVAAAPSVKKPAPSVSPAAKSAPGDSQVMLNMADTYVQQGSLDEAIEIYQKMLKKDPNNQKVKNALTRVYAMFAGINPETAVSRKAPASAAPKSSREEKDEQRVQREARERALREAQVRVQRSSPAEPPPAKTAAKQDELLQTIGNAPGDEVAGDNQDEFMTVTVAEIYTKQGLLSEALKIYQKILEIEPGNMEAQVKKQQLEKKMAEQEKLQEKAEKHEKAESKADKPKTAAEVKPVEHPAAKAKEAPPASEPAKGKGGKNDDEPPPAKGRRGRVSYV